MPIRRLAALAVASALLIPVAPAMADDDVDGEAPGWGITCQPSVALKLSADQTRATVVTTPDTRWYSLDLGAPPDDDAPPDVTPPTPEPEPSPEPIPSPEPTIDPVPDVTGPDAVPDAVAGDTSATRSRPAVRKLRCKKIDATVVVRNATTGERMEFTLSPGRTDSRGFTYDLHGGQLVTATVEQGRGEATDSARTRETAPTRPRNVVPNEVTDGTAIIDWAAPEFSGGDPVTEYQVTLGDRAYGTTPAAVSSIQLSDLVPSTDYVVKVRARNGRGLSEPGVATFRTPARPTVPSEPQDLRVTGTSQTSLTVQWSPPASDGGRPVTGYHVTLDGEHVDVVTATSATVRGLLPGSRYVIDVVALNVIGPSRAAAVAGWTDMNPVPTPLPPSPPRRLVAASATHTSITVTWARPATEGSSPITGYGIWVDGSLWGQVAGLRAEVDGLQAGTKHRFAVKANNSEGSSRATTIEAWTVMDPVPGPSAPSAPRDPQVTGMSQTEVLVDWKAPADDGGTAITGYEVRRAGAAPVTTDRTAVLVAGLEPGTEYAFEIRAMNDTGTSPAVSASGWTWMRPAPAPTAPTQPRALAAPRATQDSISLSWRPPARDGGRDVTGYAVFVDDVLWDTLPGTSATVTGLVPGTRYAFEVRAVNDVGSSRPATVAAWTQMKPVPTPTAPTAPRDVAALSVDTTSILLDWLAPLDDGGSPVVGFEVVGAGAEPVVTERTSALLTGLAPATRYDLEVRAVNAMGASAAATLEVWTPIDPVPTPMRPGVPTSLVVAAVTPTTIVLDWVAPADDGGSALTGYQVSLDGTFYDVTSSTSATVTGLRPATSYLLQVRAVNAMGTSDPVAVSGRTSAVPSPGPAPAPVPQPQPITPSTGGGAPVDIDGSARTRPQTVTGAWPARTTVFSGKASMLERSSRLVTNAGQDVAVAITYRSPSVKTASVTLNARTNAYYLKVVLKKRKVSGSVILTVSAPQMTVDGVVYEPLHSSRKFIVKDLPGRR